LKSIFCAQSRSKQTETAKTTSHIGINTRPQRLLGAGHHVDPPVGLHLPALLLTPQDLLEEVLLGLGLALLLLQRLPQVEDVLCGAQLRDAGQQHEGEEGDQQAGVAAQGQVGLDAGVLVQVITCDLVSCGVSL